MFSNTFLEIINSVSLYIAIIANVIVIIGAVPIFIWLKNLSLERKKKEINDNLNIRKNIQQKLRDHADGYDRSKPHDIGIRLVYWKNYPWKLDDDGYKQLLYYDTNLDKRLNHGTEFLINTGILVDEHIWFFGNSLYLGNFGTFIIDKSGQKIIGFREVKQKIKLVTTLKYKYIINWDFEDKIEYEPVFYIKYKYTKKKLFENQFFAQNCDDDGINNDLYFHEVLDMRNRVKSNKSMKYRYLMFRAWLRKSVRTIKSRF